MFDVLKLIRSGADYEAALAQAERYFDDPPKRGTNEANAFEVLLVLIAKYEDEAYPIPAVDPVELLQFAMTDMGRSKAELVALLGSRPRVSEVLNRKRRMTLDMIRSVSEAWKLPLEALAAPYPLADEAPREAMA